MACLQHPPSQCQQSGAARALAWPALLVGLEQSCLPAIVVCLVCLLHRVW